ncbi:MAG: SDR family oxidoreductase [Cyanobacteria bacterium J06641_5]
MFLVTGATGSIGRRAVQLLCDRDEAVRAFVRLSSRYEELETRGAEIFIGDLRCDRDIRKACRGIRHVISTHGSGRDVQEIDYRANIELIDAACEAEVEHFTFISVLGADRNYADAPTFKAKRAVEKYLRASGLNYTILQPSGLASSLLPLAERFQQTGIYLSIGDTQHRTSIVSTDDLATIAIASATCEAARNQTLPVGGPDALKRADIPRLFGRLFKKDPFVVNIPLQIFDGVRGGLSLVDAELARDLGTLRALVADEFFCTPAEIETLQSTYGLQLESVEAFLRRYTSAAD